MLHVVEAQGAELDPVPVHSHNMGVKPVQDLPKIALSVTRIPVVNISSPHTEMKLDQPFFLNIEKNPEDLVRSVSMITGILTTIIDFDDPSLSSSLLLIISVSLVISVFSSLVSQSSFRHFNTISCSGLIISGGQSRVDVDSVEVFVPSTGRRCKLPELPERRYFHTMEGMMLCGGEGDSDGSTCLSLTDGRWERTTTLIERR